ncbi:hypothetical protein D3C76_1384550 [compost metagenome]
MHQVVGTGGANLRQLAGIPAAGEFEHVRLVVERHDDRLRSAGQPPDQRHDFGGNRPALPGFQRLGRLPAEYAAFRGLSTAFCFNIRFRFIDNRYGFGVAILLRFAPGHQPMLLHQYQFRIRVGQHAFGDHF